MINNKGITLIALIITVIVMLILAGVAFGTLLGNNGLLKKVTDAGNISKMAQFKEEVGIDISEMRIQSIQDKESFTLQYVTDKLTESGKYDDVSFDETEGTITVERDGIVAVIDDNFEIVDTYQNQEQNDIPTDIDATILYLYNNGDQCVSVTGGWGLSKQSAAVSVTFDEDHITLTASGLSNVGSGIFTTNEINTGNHTKLYIEYTLGGNISSWTGALYFSSNRGDDGGTPITISGASVVCPVSSTKKIMSVNVPTNTEGYIRAGGGISNWQIYAIWLEP